MKIELLDILVCPICNNRLKLSSSAIEKEIISGILRCSCGKEYPIINGIPRFIDAINYSNSFGLQWNRFAKTQLDSVTEKIYSRRRFENEVGWDRSWAKDKWILDAGCGAGRFAEIAAHLNCNLIAMDMSSAIDAAKVNLSRFQNINFVQADLFNMPFQKCTFDGIYCIGVLQHTPDPYLALRYLLEILLPKGKFAFTIYAKRPWTKLYSKYWLRAMLGGTDQDRLLRVIEKIMPIAFPVTDILFRIPVLSKIMQFLIPVANYVGKSDLTRKQRYEEAILDTFDMLSPKFDSPVDADYAADVVIKYGIDNYKIITRQPFNIIGTKIRRKNVKQRRH